MFAQNSTVNFAGMMGDNLLKIENGSLISCSMNHEWNRMQSYDSNVIMHTRTIVNLEIIVHDEGLVIWHQPDVDMTNIRNKFVEQCTVEELLVAIQAKMSKP